MYLLLSLFFFQHRSSIVFFAAYHVHNTPPTIIPAKKDDKCILAATSRTTMRAIINDAKQSVHKMLKMCPFSFYQGTHNPMSKSITSLGVVKNYKTHVKLIMNHQPATI